jgi:N-acyl amino acid synthase of PEP-CTERM/exosortase system
MLDSYSVSVGGGKDRAWSGGEADDLAAAYDRHFSVLPCDDPASLERAHRLRYQVYCVENPFEDPADNPGGLERDAYDARSVHSLLRHRGTGHLVGAVRLILPDPQRPERSFPMQEVCADPRVGDPAVFPVRRAAEVSRFCVSREFRRRLGETRYADIGAEEARARAAEERRLMPYVTLGLIRGLVRMSVEHGVRHWCIVVEPPLLRLLKTLGFVFDNLGPLVQHHGLRQPCHADLERLLAGVRRLRPDVWQVVTDRGALWRALFEPARAAA